MIYMKILEEKAIENKKIKGLMKLKALKEAELQEIVMALRKLRRKYRYFKCFWSICFTWFRNKKSI
jgi:hypothetical protein